MRIHLYHGRKDPAAEMDDWGHIGPTLDGVDYVHCVYKHHLHVKFVSPAAAQIAHELTGWSFLDSMALDVDFTEDCIRCRDDYYGDWEFQSTESEL